MTRKEKEYLVSVLDTIYTEVHENNIMLRQIIQVINTFLARHNQENEDDFDRNVLANLISSIMYQT